MMRRLGAAVVLLLILVMAAWLRLKDPVYNTAFGDEMIEITYGRQFLANPLSPPYAQTLYWHYGWYLWPALAALADRAGGLGAVRQLAGLFGLVTIVACWGFSRRLYSPTVGLASAAFLAVLGPAVFASRFATYDAPALCFLALGLWMYVRAWQEDERVTWLFAAVLFFASFLSKYIVALYFPFLVLLCLRKGRRPFFFFSVPLALCCGIYALAFRTVLSNVIHMVGTENQGFQATSQQLWQIYVVARHDFWILLGLSLLVLIPVKTKLTGAPPRSYRDSVILALLLWLGAAVIFGLQMGSSAANLRFFKHVVYSMLFLLPLAAEGLLRLTRYVPQKVYAGVSAVVVVLVAIGIGWSGKAFRSGELVFWPSVDPAIALLEGQLTPDQRILTNDLALRYYFCPPLPIDNIDGPYFFAHEGETGAPAYARAINEGYFDYVVLVGKGIEESAGKLQATIRPLLPARYQLRLKMPDPQLQRRLEVFERTDPSVQHPEHAVRVEITSPRNDEVVETRDGETTIHGTAYGMQLGWYIRAEVLTNRWYPQGGKIFPNATDGTFSQTVSLGSRCYHLLRVTMYDEHDRPVAFAVAYGIARANPDGSAPVCN